jgi:hypothetical protein
MLRATMGMLRRPGFWAFASLVVAWLALYGLATYIGPAAPPTRVLSLVVHRHVAGPISLVLGLVGLGFGYRLARRHASETAALYAVVLVGLGTGALLQGAVRGGGLAICFAAWLVEHWDRTRGRRTVGRAAALGALAVATLVVVVPFGAMGPPSFSAALWSSRTGSFVWAPLGGLAVIGLLAAPWHRARATAAVCLGLFLVLVVLDGLRLRPGPALGHRPLVAATGLFVLGLAFLVDRLRALHHRWPGIAPHAALWAVLGPLLVLNLELTRQVAYGSRSAVRTSAPQSTAALYTGSFARMIEQSFDRVGAPTAFPANVVWALRHGLAPSRYDVVVSSPIREITAAELSYLAGDWGPLVFGTRTTGPRATLLVPLAEPRARLELEALPGPQAALALEVGGWRAPPVPIVPYVPIAITPPAGVLGVGTNEVVLGPGVRFLRLRVVPLSP